VFRGPFAHDWMRQAENGALSTEYGTTDMSESKNRKKFYDYHLRDLEFMVRTDN
jgi:hypothetical protein